MSATTTSRPPSRIQPIAALIALRNLMKNPQDTRQVALLTSALRGKSGIIQFNRFKSSPVGQRIIAEQRRLGPVLDNHAALAQLPENSFGRHYLAFMAEENLTAKGLEEVTANATDAFRNSSEDVRIFADRTRDLHDLYHVLTGYGRDEIGEISVLAFSYPQQRLRSYAVIAFFGALNFSRILVRHRIPAAGVFATVLEAYRHGKQAAWLPGEDVEAMLGENIDMLRRRLNIAPPEKYSALAAQIRQKTAWRNGPIFSQGQLIAS
jgi:ubiquinone biosynthesis protein COQ4